MPTKNKKEEEYRGPRGTGPQPDAQPAETVAQVALPQQQEQESAVPQQDTQETQGTVTAQEAQGESAEEMRQRHERERQELDAAYNQLPAAERMDYATWLSRAGEPSEEEQRKRLKRARGNAVIAGIGDVLSSVANMWATSRGAKSTYKAGTLSAAAQKRAERLEEESKALRAAYRKYRTASDAAERNEASTTMREHLRAMQALRQQQWRERQAAETARLAQRKADDNAKLTEARIESTEAQRDYAKERTTDLQKTRQARVEKLQRSGSSGGGSRTGGSSRGTEFLGVTYPTVAGYQQAVMTGALRYGVKTNLEGLTGQTRARRIAEIAAEVQAKAAQQKQQSQQTQGKKGKSIKGFGSNK